MTKAVLPDVPARGDAPFPLVPAPAGAVRFRRHPKGRFVNLDGSGPQPFQAVFKWGVVDSLTRKRRKSPPHAPIPTVAPDVALLRTPPAAGESPRLVWLGHATWLVQLAGKSFLLDPVLGEATLLPKRNVAPPIAAADLPRIDAQLVSHNHYDHLDSASLTTVGAPVMTGLGNARHLRGLPTSELGWWDAAEVGDVRITYVPSQHWSRRSLADANASLWGGFVLEGGGAAIYHAGDTAYFDGFAAIGARFPQLDVALLPIGAYDPAWFMSKQHMNPRESLDAFRELGARRVVAMHWGTFKLTDEPLDEPPALFRAEARARGLADDVARVAAVGEVVTLPLLPR